MAPAEAALRPQSTPQVDWLVDEMESERAVVDQKMEEGAMGAARIVAADRGAVCCDEKGREEERCCC